MSVVATTRTTPSLADFTEALLREEPEMSKEGAAILWAHFAGETGSGRFCWNWNLGNMKWSKGCGLDYVALHGVWEMVDGQRLELSASDPGSWFRAYPSLRAGMVAFIAAKKNPASRYASAWAKVLVGDPEGYAAELRAHGYYTAPLADYQRSMRKFFDAFMASDAFEHAQRKIGFEADALPDTVRDLGDIDG